MKVFLSIVCILLFSAGALAEASRVSSFEQGKSTASSKSSSNVYQRPIDLNQWVLSRLNRKSKAEELEKMIQERKLYVTVDTDQVKSELHQFNMNVSGVVNAPFSETLETVYDFEKLTEVSGHFKRVKYDKKQHKLFMLVEALGYRARLMMELSSHNSGSKHDLKWHIISGRFKGMRGVIRYGQLDLRYTMVTLVSQFQAKQLPLPKVLMGFALEVVTYQVAQRMRLFIENSFNQQMNQAKIVRDQQIQGTLDNGF